MITRLLGRLRNTARTHPKATAAIGLGGVAMLIFVVVWFQPQTLFFDRVVEDEFPQAGPTTTTAPGEDPAAEPDGEEPDSQDPGPGSDLPSDPPLSGPVALLSGEFGSRSRYTVTGTATVFQLEDGTRLLRLEDFASTNGPDLYVYLTVANAVDDDGALNMDFVDLGLLAGNIGNQNYVIPDDVDLSLYDTVVIWCRRFTVGFGAADLMVLG
jgi:hypothetical protein